MKKKLILVSHGTLSEGMAYSAQMICGEDENLSFYGMMPGEHYAPIVEAVRKEAQEHPDTQYLVLADLFGGSVCNGCTELAQLPNLRLISGMNLALVIALMFAEAPVSDETLEKYLREGQAGIREIKIDPEETNNDEEDFF